MIGAPICRDHMYSTTHSCTRISSMITRRVQVLAQDISQISISKPILSTRFILSMDDSTCGRLLFRSNIFNIASFLKIYNCTWLTACITLIFQNVLLQVSAFGHMNAKLSHAIFCFKLPSTSLACMANDQPSAEERTRYENLRKEIAAALTRKRNIDKQLAQTEQSLYDLESTYLTETATHSGGNIIQGFDGYLKNQNVGRRKYEVLDTDRMFSNSSATYQKVLHLFLLRFVLFSSVLVAWPGRRWRWDRGDQIVIRLPPNSNLACIHFCGAKEKSRQRVSTSKTCKRCEKERRNSQWWGGLPSIHRNDDTKLKATQETSYWGRIGRRAWYFVSYMI